MCTWQEDAQMRQIRWQDMCTWSSRDKGLHWEFRSQCGSQNTYESQENWFSPSHYEGGLYIAVYKKVGSWLKEAALRNEEMASLFMHTHHTHIHIYAYIPPWPEQTLSMIGWHLVSYFQHTPKAVCYFVSFLYKVYLKVYFKWILPRKRFILHIPGHLTF